MPYIVAVLTKIKMFLNKYFSIYCLFTGQFPSILDDYFLPFSTVLLRSGSAELFMKSC